MSVRVAARIAMLAGLAACSPAVGQELSARNLLVNPGFEFGAQGWRFDTDKTTDARFVVDEAAAFAGNRSALVKVDRVDGWGVQFGQRLEAGVLGKTYTFAVFGKSEAGPVAVSLQIERSAKPFDRAAKSERYTLTSDEWTELHVTFSVDQPFPQGWFAYVESKQANVTFRLDAFRLYEGAYMPYGKTPQGKPAAEQPPDVQVRLFDTRTLSSGPLPAGAFSSVSKWQQLSEEATDHRFQGNAVLANDRLAVVLRPQGPGAEVYARGPGGVAKRAVLAPASLSGEPPPSNVRLVSVAVLENTPGAAIVNATFQAERGDPMQLRFELGIGRPFVVTEAGKGTAGLRVGAPARFLVLPDFFADDVVIDATEIPVPQAEVPAEHLLLHMAGQGESIVMSVSETLQDDVKVGISGNGDKRRVDQSTLRFGPKGRIWVALIENENVWHMHNVRGDKAGVITPIDWIAPFPAQWRVDWSRDDGLTGSWEMVAQKEDGRFIKHGWFGSPSDLPESRRRWTTVLGHVPYPCWIDRKGRGHLQPLAKTIHFEGPALIYPINRVQKTPLSAFSTVDILRATLGVGPCEYILDVEGQGATMVGRATCATRNTLNAIYEKRRQKQEQHAIEQALVDVVLFVVHIRGRIDAYRDFGHELLGYLEDQKKAHPELHEFLADMESLTRQIDVYFAAREKEIQTPQYIADLADKFRATLMNDDSDDAFDRCKEITEAFTAVGGNQDELVGESRMAVKILRQRAGLAMATDPRVGEIAREIRDRTQKVLRNSSSYEAPRH